MGPMRHVPGAPRPGAPGENIFFRRILGRYIPNCMICIVHPLVDRLNCVLVIIIIVGLRFCNNNNDRSYFPHLKTSGVIPIGRLRINEVSRHLARLLDYITHNTRPSH